MKMTQVWLTLIVRKPEGEHANVTLKLLRTGRDIGFVFAFDQCEQAFTAMHLPHIYCYFVLQPVLNYEIILFVRMQRNFCNL